MTVQAKVVRIGNSRGIRIPRSLLEQAGLVDTVQMTVEGNRLVIQGIHVPRQNWAVQYAKMAEHGDDHLLDESTPTQWDDTEWAW
jgi:antitoxin MazE